MKPARLLSAALGALLALPLALLLAAWVWSARDGSLAQALRWTESALASPDGEPLQASGASGSLREGGRIERLHWQRDGLTVEIDALDLRWDSGLWPDLLLRRELKLQTLSAARLRIEDRRPATPTVAPTGLLLPWLREVELPLRAGSIRIDGAAEVEIGLLQALYRYRAGSDGPAHELEVGSLRFGAGDYRLQARLQAGGALRLEASAQGRVEARLPGGQALMLDARADVNGRLAGQDAELALKARIGEPDGGADRPALRGQATLRPWADLPLPQAELELRAIDLALLWPQAPRSRIDGRLQADSAQAGRWRLAADLRNRSAGAWDRGALPVERLSARVELDGGRWSLQQLEARLSGGRIEASGSAELATGDADLLQRLGRWEGRINATLQRPRALLGRLALQPFALRAGASHATGDTTGFELAIEPAGAGTAADLPAPRLDARGKWSAGLWRIDRAELAWLDARARASGLLRLPAQLEGEVALDLPGASAGARIGRERGEAQAGIADAAVLLRWLRQVQARAQPLLAGSGLKLPEAVASAALRGSGSLRADWSGALHPARLPGRWSARLQVADAQSGDALRLRDALLAAEGRGGDFTLDLGGELTAPAWSASPKLRADGSLALARAGVALTLNLQQMQASARVAGRSLSARLERATRLSLRGGELELDPGRLLVTQDAANAPAQFAWERSRWAQGRIESRGRASGIALGWIDQLLASAAAPHGPIAQSGLAGDLLLQADWDLDLPLQAARAQAAAARARVEVARSSGDLELVSGEGARSERLAVGIEQASMRLELLGRQLQGRLRWASRNAGQAGADFATELMPPAAQASWDWRGDAPLSGRLQARLPQIGFWSKLTPPGWRLRGSLQADATLAGTRARPEWRGTLQADHLALRSLVDGLDFSDGELRATLEGQTLAIAGLKLRGAGGAGELLGSGSARWDGAAPRVALDLQARQLRLLARADRRLTLSGDIAARLEGSTLDLSGRLRADQAHFLLPESSAATLGEDVVVKGRERPAQRAGGALQTRVRLELALGDSFRLQGMGIDTHLQGDLLLSSDPDHAAPRLAGVLRTAKGSYRAYGQALTLESGVLSFNGPYDNPALDILALRPVESQREQRVGVQIAGTALAPRIRLYADPELPDSEKLAWLVLGRPASGAGAESALLQQAALALLSGQGRAGDGAVRRALGLDELAFSGEVVNPDGSTRAAAIRLGKRLSNQLYLSYSRSVVGATGTVAVLYDVSRRLTLRAQAGDDNAIDLIFTQKFDGRASRKREPARENGARAATMRDSSL